MPSVSGMELPYNCITVLYTDHYVDGLLHTSLLPILLSSLSNYILDLNRLSPHIGHKQAMPTSPTSPTDDCRR